MTETWMVLNSGYLDAATNMAIDEALLILHKNEDIPPTIRFYGWKQPSLSVGYFQSVEHVIDLAALATHNCALVRRLTGGSAVLHDDELTYSIIVNEDHPKIPHTVNEAYYVLAQGLLEGYRKLGITASFTLPSILKRERSAVCFETPAIYEMIVDGKKVSGNAQTRKMGVLLQHGSIPLTFDEDMLFDLFTFSTEELRQQKKADFLEKAISINNITEEQHTYDSLKQAFLHGFEKSLQIKTEPLELTADHWKLIHHLIETKYSTTDWNLNRTKERNLKS